MDISASMDFEGNRPSLITEGLYLGSALDAKNRKVLVQLGITHIVQVVPFSIPDFADEFKYLTIPVLDSTQADLKTHFTSTFTFITEGLQAGRVLVHCGAGISRSPTVIIAFLMRRESWKYKQAEEYVRKRRTIIEPNDGFVTQLLAFERELFFWSSRTWISRHS